ncbi:Vitamin B12 transporter BtuB [Oligella sp. MSHR50489EDL]|uniref:TonB-dependent receptor n=1 Tax=Oligella sp. MSHR50489EDL TaxID=3139409 RepID=UPI003D81A19E
MKFKRLICVLFGACVYSGATTAQDKNEDGLEIQELESLTVYSRGIKESRLDSPFAIDVIGGDVIERRGMSNVLQSLASLPSLNIHDGNNASTTAIWIRGVGSLTNTSMDDNSVDVVIDGVSNGKTGLTRPLLDVERVEIAKGPQGTLFGSKSEAGNVIVKTYDPHNEFEGRVGLKAGNLDLWGINSMLNIPLSDQWSFRIAAQVERFDDYVKDSDTGRPLNDKTNDAVQAKLRWNDGDRNDAILTVYYDKRKNFLPLILSDPFSYRTETGGLNHSADRKNAGISLRYTHDFDFGRFESTTAYHYHKANVNRPLRPLDMLGVFYDALQIAPPLRPLLDGYYYQGANNRQNIDEKVNQFTQEIKLSGETESGLKWITGAFFEKRKRDFDYDALRGVNMNTPKGPLPIGADPFNAVMRRSFDYQTEAVFGEVTVPLTESLNFIAGGRYSHEELDYQGTWISNPTIPKPSYTENHKISENFVSGRVGFNFKMTPEWRLYVLQSWGNKFGGFADYGSNIAYGTDNLPYASAKISTQEIGSKYLSSDGRFGFDVALFNNKVKDDHVTVVLYPSYLTGTGNADTRTRGVEIGVSAQLTEQIAVRADGTYLDTEVTRVPSQSTQITSVGNRLPQAAKFSGNLGLTYMSNPISLGFLGQSRVHGDVALRYVGSRYAQPDNVQKLGSYTVIDASVGLQSKHHDVLFWVKNLTDREYHAFGIMPGYAGYPAADRTFGVNYSFKF